PLSARLVARIGQRPTAFAGVAVVGLGLLPLAFTGVDTPVTLVALLLLAQGVGHGLLAVAFTDILTATLEVRPRGVVGSPAQLTRTLGTVRGGALLTALQAAGAAGLSGIDGFLAGYRYAFLVSGGGLLVALLPLLPLPG